MSEYIHKTSLRERIARLEAENERLREEFKLARSRIQEGLDRETAYAKDSWLRNALLGINAGLDERKGEG